MGTIINQCTDDAFFRGGEAHNKNKLQIKDEVENLMINNNNKYGDDNDSGSDNKHNPEILESYDARQNFFYLDQSAMKIQRSFRSYISKRQETIINNDTSRKYTEFSSSSLSNTSKNLEAAVRGLFLLKKKQFQYKGSFNKNKKKHGFGIVRWEDGSKLYSVFNNNKTNGISKFLDSTNRTFVGEYVNNRPLGYGVYIEKDEVSYEGYWTNNNLNGYSFESWKDGTTYNGEMKECKKEGIGTYQWPDGTVYQGEWKNDKMEGYGILTYNDQREYEGEIRDGMMDGYGKFSWPDGKRFFGHYRKDTKEGFGMFIWSQCPLRAFVGFWLQGKQNGIGIKINDCNVKYGIWVKGVKESWLQGPWELRKKCPNDKRSYLSLIQNGYQNLINIINR